MDPMKNQLRERQRLVFALWGVMFVVQVVCLAYGIFDLSKHTSSSVQIPQRKHARLLFAEFVIAMISMLTAGLISPHKETPWMDMLTLSVLILLMYITTRITMFVTSASPIVVSCLDLPFSNNVLTQNIYSSLGPVAMCAVWSVLKAVTVTVYPSVNTASSGYDSYTVLSNVEYYVLVTVITGYFVIDICLCDHFLRYIVSPYLVLFVGLTKTLCVNTLLGFYENRTRNSVLLVIIVLLVFAKTGIMLWKHYRYSNGTRSTLNQVSVPFS